MCRGEQNSLRVHISRFAREQIRITPRCHLAGRSFVKNSRLMARGSSLL